MCLEGEEGDERRDDEETHIEDCLCLVDVKWDRLFEIVFGMSSWVGAFRQRNRGCTLIFSLATEWGTLATHEVSTGKSVLGHRRTDSLSMGCMSETCSGALHGHSTGPERKPISPFAPAPTTPRTRGNRHCLEPYL